MSFAAPSSRQCAMLVGRGVWIELLRRKDVYVLLSLMAVFLIGVLAVRIVGIENPSTGTFLLNLGLSLSSYVAHLLTLLLMSRQVPDEIENRTLYPLLARPLSREVLLLGKWLACSVCGVGIFAILCLLSGLTLPRMEAVYTGTLAQALVLLPVSLAVLASITLALSVIAPKGVVLVLAGGLYFFGPALFSLLERAGEGHAVLHAVSLLAAYLPDFSKLNLITRLTDGIAPVAAGEFLGLVAYGGLVTAVALALAMLRFRRRSL